jgi:hypothetical protein
MKVKENAERGDKRSNGKNRLGKRSHGGKKGMRGN